MNGKIRRPKKIVNTVNKLRKKINKEGYYMKDIANILGISRYQTTKKVFGENQFLLSEIIILMDLFNCSFEELFQDYIEAFKEEKQVKAKTRS